MKKRLLVLVLLLALGAGGYAIWKSRAAADAAAPLCLSGNVDIRSVNLSFRVGGRLATVAVDEGTAVKPGEVLATLDPAPFELALRQAEASRESTRREVPMAEQHAASMKAMLDLRRAGYRQEQVAQARASLEARRVLLANAERDYERQKKLVERGAVSRTSFDAAQMEYDSQRSLVVVDEARLAELTAGFRSEEIAQAEAQYESALASVSQLQAKLNAAEVACEQAALNLADTKLEAPSAGIIMTRALEPGSMVAAGAPVLVLSLREPVWVRAYVDEPHLDRVRLGQRVRVHTDGGRCYEGRIGFISPQAEFTPKTVETVENRTTFVYRLRIVVEGEEAASLNQGAPVTVEIFDLSS